LSRQSLEQHQVLIYLVAITCGLFIGNIFPDNIRILETFLWPVLGLLLYSTFTQVPLSHLQEAFADTRFLTAAVTGNFIVLPMVVWGLMILLPDVPAIRLGVLLVLLVPCTDWFITFTHLGGGDTRHAIAFTPVSLLLQIILLPLYLWLFLGENVSVTLVRTEMFLAFAGLIIMPLIAAFLTEKWIDKNTNRVYLLERLAWCPVPMLAFVVFIIAASQVSIVMNSAFLLGNLLLVFTAFLVISAYVARLIAKLFNLPSSQGRVLAFSFGTRNSFVVLPLALALPPSFEMVVVIIVFQSLVELFGMVVYLWWVPQKLFPTVS